MMKGQEEEEFITVRVQDPRIQDQNSWAAYVDYKIFLYTNSKAFTVKTSCVRRRYREFVWLRRQLQKNAGLVPLPELPGKKPFFQVNDIESIERRRQGLQQFLEKASIKRKLPHALWTESVSPAGWGGPFPSGLAEKTTMPDAVSPVNLYQCDLNFWRNARQLHGKKAFNKVP
ncbi:sorting nexin-11-like isoform X2 [Stegostoma tigrinum]|uniref:sorting nexin-11-like isoform X2 n=1 Tax=Stegostoma tigrinum TaxID=3053191 RepID=UPI00202B966F|nr:sorting nexin-11-like isoform X2 [Stegostoma tigrinum]